MKNKNIKIIFAILFVVLIITPICLNAYYNFLLKPIAKTNQETKIFVITPGTPVVEISSNLKKEGLIKNPFAFRFLISRMGIGKNIQAGDFRLSPSQSSREIAELLTHGAIDIWVTIPEGLRKEEQAEIFEEKLKFASNDVYQFNKDEYIKIAQEGFMFPDTYLVPKDASAQDIANLLKNTFENKIDPEIFASGRKNNLTENQLITLASIIEREAKTNDEKSVISGILLNRIKSGIALQVDATIQYAKGYDIEKETWWQQITTDDYRLAKSPYNTYLHPGLPPGPISNPGVESILAAANPKDTDYLYYLHDAKGNIHYAETIDEHNQNIEQYLY